MNDLLHIILSCFIIIVGTGLLVYGLSRIQMRAWISEIDRYFSNNFNKNQKVEEDEKREEK
jgi:hypothetical protein